MVYFEARVTRRQNFESGCASAVEVVYIGKRGKREKREFRRLGKCKFARMAI